MVLQLTADQVLKKVLRKCPDLMLKLVLVCKDLFLIILMSLQYLTYGLEHLFTTYDSAGQTPKKHVVKITSVANITGSITHLENCQKCIIFMKKHDLFKQDFSCYTALPHMSNQMPFLNPEDIFSLTYIILLSSFH